MPGSGESAYSQVHNLLEATLKNLGRLGLSDEAAEGFSYLVLGLFILPEHVTEIQRALNLNHHFGRGLKMLYEAINWNQIVGESKP